MPASSRPVSWPAWVEPDLPWLGQGLAVDLANTVIVVRKGELVDLLADPDGLRRWLEIEGVRIGTARELEADLGRIRSLRDGARKLLHAAAEGRRPPPACVRAVNAAAALNPTHERLVAGAESLEKRWVNVASDAASVFLAEVARSAIATVAGEGRDRLSICRAPRCGMLYVGRANRRWCSAACGNRARVARHYERHAATDRAADA